MRSRAKRLSWLLSVSAALVLLLGQRPSLHAAENILIIVADDFGVELLENYGVGTEPATTPNLSRMAEEGVLFTNAWSNPVCSTTRATLQTGLYSFRTGIGETVDMDELGLRLDEEVTLADLVSFADPAYATGAFGKWHLNGEDVVEGFGYDAVRSAGYDFFVGTMRNLAFDGFGDYTRYTRVVNGVTTEVENRYITTDTATWARTWMAGATEPWLAYVAFHAPHVPFHVPPDELHGEDACEVGFTDPVPCFRAAVEAMDFEIGRMLEVVPNDGSTTVFFVGDNGTDAAVIGFPFGPDQAKGSLFEGGVRVPLLAWNPELYAPNTVDALVQTTDFFATVGEIAGIDVSQVPVLDSVSIVPYLEGGSAPDEREFLFAELFRPNGCEAFDTRGTTARDSRYKLIRFAEANGGGEALYDLSGTPPWEENDLLPDLSSEEQAAYDALSEHLDSLLGGVGAACEFPRECCSKSCVEGVCQ